MSKRKPYVRPMQGWWKKNPYYFWHLMSESMAVFVAAYAFIMIWGLFRLSQGEAAWNSFLATLQSPVSVIVHVVLLVAMLYHLYAWFKVMPLSMPPVLLGKSKLTPCAIVTGGCAAAAVSNLALFVLIWRVL